MAADPITPGNLATPSKGPTVAAAVNLSGLPVRVAGHSETSSGQGSARRERCAKEHQHNGINRPIDISTAASTSGQLERSPHASGALPPKSSQDFTPGASLTYNSDVAGPGAAVDFNKIARNIFMKITVALPGPRGASPDVNITGTIHLGNVSNGRALFKTLDTAFIDTTRSTKRIALKVFTMDYLHFTVTIKLTYQRIRQSSVARRAHFARTVLHPPPVARAAIATSNVSLV